jgi:hypothetical protein
MMILAATIRFTVATSMILSRSVKLPADALMLPQNNVVKSHAYLIGRGLPYRAWPAL